MGKKLIIKDADFSKNGIFGGADLTSLFSWETGTWRANGTENTSTTFNRSNSVDVSAYVGKTMNVSWCNYLTSSGGRPTYYGLIFMDENEEVLPKGSGYYSEQVLKGDKDNGTGECVDKNIVIPEGAVYFKTTYLKDGSFYGDPVPFYCMILPD